MEGEAFGVPVGVALFSSRIFGFSAWSLGSVVLSLSSIALGEPGREPFGEPVVFLPAEPQV